MDMAITAMVERFQKMTVMIEQKKSNGRSMNNTLNELIIIELNQCYRNATKGNEVVWYFISVFERFSLSFATYKLHIPSTL